jgi:hypothetical protein
MGNAFEIEFEVGYPIFVSPVVLHAFAATRFRNVVRRRLEQRAIDRLERLTLQVSRLLFLCSGVEIHAPVIHRRLRNCD